MACAFIDHTEAAVCHGSCNAGRKECLTQSRAPVKQKIAGFQRKLLRIDAADRQIPSHDGSGACTGFGIVSVRIIVQPELVEGLTTHIQEGQFLLLLLPAQLCQAFAHGRTHITAAAATVTDGTVVQITFLKIKMYQLLPLLLQCQILLLHFLHGSLRIVAI